MWTDSSIPMSENSSDLEIFSPVSAADQDKVEDVMDISLREKNWSFTARRLESDQSFIPKLNPILKLFNF